MLMVNNVNNSNTATSSYSYLQYKNKVTGLASGMDIDSIMEKLMKAESAQMEKLQQQKQKYEWKRDAYREVNTTLSAFEKGIFDNYGLSKNWNAKTATSTSSSVSVTANSTASGNLTITEATAATAGQKVGDLVGVTSQSTLSELGMTTDGKIKIKAINDSGTYTEKEISYKTTDTISDLMSKINNSGVGITALASENKISLQANSTGTGVDGSINVTEDDGGVFKALGLLATGTGKVAKGTNGSMVVNGVKMESTSNKYNVSGYTVKVTNNIVAGTDAPAKISSTTETKSIVDKVKEFVATYNGLIEDLNKRVSEKKNLSYQPLTDAQKAELKDDEIKKWEDKAKAGLLKSDANINKVLSDMRSTISNYGAGSDDMLAKIGISTSKTWSDNGKLEIDENKLTKALEEDPNVVMRIFTGDPEKGTKGIVSELKTTAQNAVKNIEKTAGRESASDSSYALGKNLQDINMKIDDWKDRLKGIEERYWKQFAAMESAIQKANSQSAIFAQ